MSLKFFMVWSRYVLFIFTAPQYTLLEIYQLIHSPVRKHFKLFHFCYYEQFHNLDVSPDTRTQEFLWDM